jgi:TolB-like protein/class 3 adenylate cyclase/Flp pilus assembly protein TadD
MRQLAAILFADMTGYTAVMQENEQLARKRRKRLKQVLDIAIPQFNGKVLQYYGDGSLSIFNSAIDSVRSAISIQQLLQQEPVVPVRIGIHTGDVIIEEEAIYGDGVNLASRIESLAVPGGIFVSEKVFDEIRNQENILTREMGYFELKNVKQPVRIFAIANHGIAVPAREELRGKTQPSRNRLAVLPFVNISADPDNEYFSDGITEELLNTLAKVNDLKVISRTSSFAFKGKNEDVRDIGIQLNVDKILEGSVRKAGNRVRITAQLVNAADGYHIWSEVYDRNLTDIFAVQDEISGIIANSLRENLSATEQKQPVLKAKTKNTTAYTYYLKGLHYRNKLTPADLLKAIEFFERAIAIEPGYAHAYAMAASTYSIMGARGQMLPDKAFEVVHRYADKAMELDDTIAESHVAKANAYLLYDWRWKAACEVLEKAIDLNPAATDAYELLGMYNVIVGKKEKAVQLLEQAEQIDPLSPAITLTLGSMYTFAHRFDDAIKQADKLLEINPQMRGAMELKGWSTGMKGNWPEALVLFKEVHRLTNHPLKGLMGLAYSYGITGQRKKALACIEKMEQRQREEPDSVIDPDLAGAWLGLRDLDKSFYYLNQCIDKRVGPVSYFIQYPAFEAIKNDPRYIELQERMGLSVG